LKGDQTIAVFAQGPVGLSASLLASRMGARVIALDVSASRLARAREMGADALINPQETPDVVGAIRSLTQGLGAQAALEASSSPDARRCYGVLDPSIGFAGTKMSGYGNKGGPQHVDGFLVQKVIYIRRA
jgi:threonine dehydrogenase-like Zn-dependent dehydrogenase